MNKKRLFLVSLMGIVMTFTIGASIGQGDVSAKQIVDNMPESIMRKAIFQGVYNCYTDSNGYIKDKVDMEGWLGIGSLIGVKSPKHFVSLVSGLRSAGFWDWGNINEYNVGTDALSCGALFEGESTLTNGYNRGLPYVTGHTPPNPSDTEGVIRFMEDMGYEVSKPAQSDPCYHILYKTNQSDKILTSQNVCRNLSDKTMRVEGVNGNSTDFEFRVKNKNDVCLYLGYYLEYGDGAMEKVQKGCTTIGDTYNGDVLESVVMNACGGPKCTVPDGSITFEAKGNEEADSSKGHTAIFVNDSAKDAAEKAVSYLSDEKFNNSSELKIDDAEERILYQEYLEKFYKVKVDCSKTDSSLSNGSLAWYDRESNAMKTCIYITQDAERTDKPLNGIQDGQFSYHSIKNMNDLLEKIKALPDEYDEETLGRLEDVSSEDPFDNEEQEDPMCQNQEGAKSLGWIVCPILEWAGEASTQIYDEYVAPSLEVEPTLFNGEGDNVATAWAQFRDISNVVFIILLLVVIFSQLTGIGIDNYGIKKILPRLIVAAILINLSYLICIIAVDISNIVGNGAQAMFDALGSQLQPSLSGIQADEIENANLTGSLVSVGVLAALVGAVGAFWANAAIVLSLLVGAIGVVISLFFLFILLAVRKAAIVVLVVLSPLAVVCYMLPNTKKLFDKWLKIFEGLLLVYPIAGVLVGGGDYISRLLLSNSDGFFSALTAMIVGIVPVFFIPTVLRSSFAAMGKIGERIAGFGRGASGTATRAIRNTDAYRGLQEASRRRATRIRAGVDANGNPIDMSGVRGGLRSLIRGGNRGMARARAQYLSDQSDINRQNSLMGTGFEAGLAGVQDAARRNRSKDHTARMDSQLRSEGVNELSQLQERWNEAFRAGADGADDLDALTNIMTERFGAGAANSIANSLADNMTGIAQNANYQSSMQQLQRTMLDNKDFANGMKSKAADAYQMISNGGMINGQYRDLVGAGGFAENNTTNTTARDWATQSRQSLDRAIAAGALGETMIRSIVNSNDSSIQSGILSDESKMAVLNGYLDTLPGSPAPSTPSPAPSSGDSPTAENAPQRKTFTPATYRSGDHTFTRQSNGRWTDENGNEMGGGFSTKIEHDARAQQQIRENARKSEMYRQYSDERIARLASDSNPRNARIRQSAREEAERRGINFRQPDIKPGTTTQGGVYIPTGAANTIEGAKREAAQHGTDSGIILPH